MRGYDIRRGNWRMLELAGAAAITVSDTSHNEIPQNKIDNNEIDNNKIESNEITLVGEIVDSKCFLGVMKPGDGPIHKACADLCLRGDIPPMFIANNSAGELVGYLLTNANGNSAATKFSQLTAEKVHITGQLKLRGELPIIMVSEIQLNKHIVFNM